MLLTDDVAEAGGSPLSVEDGAHVVLDVGWGCVFMIRGHPPLGSFAGSVAWALSSFSWAARRGGIGVLCFSLGSRLRGNDGGDARKGRGGIWSGL